MEEAIGITCGNLALLQPLFRRFFSNKDARFTARGPIPPSYSFTATIKSGSNNATSAKNILPSSRLASKTGRASGLYTRMSEDLEAPDDRRSRRKSNLIIGGHAGTEADAEMQDIEMQDRVYPARTLEDEKAGEGIVIVVQTDVTVEKERSRDDEARRLKTEYIDPLRKAPAKVSCEANNVWHEDETENSLLDFRVVRERVDSYSRGR